MRCLSVWSIYGEQEGLGEMELVCWRLLWLPQSLVGCLAAAALQVSRRSGQWRGMGTGNLASCLVWPQSEGFEQRW